MASNAVSLPYDAFHPFEFEETTVKVLADSSTHKVVPSKFNINNEPCFGSRFNPCHRFLRPNRRRP